MNNELVAIKLLHPDIFTADDIINFKKLFNSLDVKTIEGLFSRNAFLRIFKEQFQGENIWQTITFFDKKLSGRVFPYIKPNNFPFLKDPELVHKIFDQDSIFMDHHRPHTQFGSINQLCFLNIYESLDAKFISDKDLAFKAIKMSPDIYKVIKAEFKNDKEIVMHAMNSCPEPKVPKYLLDINEKLKNDKEVIYCAVKNYWDGFTLASKNLRDSKKLASAAIQLSPNSFQFLSKSLRMNEKLALQALTRSQECRVNNHRINCNIFKMLPGDLKISPSFIKKALCIDPKMYSVLNVKLKKNKEIILTALSNANKVLYNSKLTYDVFESIPKNMRNDSDIVHKAIELDGSYLRYTNQEWRSDPSIVFMAVKSRPDIIAWAADSLKKDKKFILSIVEYKKSTAIFDNLQYEYSSKTEENKKFLNKVFAIAPDIIDRIDMELSNKQVIKAIYAGQFHSLPYRYRNNLNFAKIAIKIDRNNFSYLGESINSRAEFRDIEESYDDIPF